MLAARLERVEAERERIRGDIRRGIRILDFARQPILLERLRVLVAVGREGIELRAVREIEAGIELENLQLVVSIAFLRAEIRIAVHVRHVRVRVGGEVGGVDDALVDGAAVAGAMVMDLRRDIEIAVVDGLKAGIARDIVGVAAAVHVAAIRAGQGAAGRIFLEDDVDDTRDGIAAVLRRGAVRQHLDVVDRIERNEIEVDPGAALEGAAVDLDVGGAVPPLAVDEHQHVVAAQSAQSRLQSLAGHVVTEGLGDEGRHDLRQRGQQVGIAGDCLQRGGAHDLHRRRAVRCRDAGLARAGHDDFVEHVGGRGAGRVRGTRTVGRGLCADRAGAQQE